VALLTGNTGRAGFGGRIVEDWRKISAIDFFRTSS